MEYNHEKNVEDIKKLLDMMIDVKMTDEEKKEMEEKVDEIKTMLDNASKDNTKKE